MRLGAGHGWVKLAVGRKRHRFLDTPAELHGRAVGSGETEARVDTAGEVTTAALARDWRGRRQISTVECGIDDEEVAMARRWR